MSDLDAIRSLRNQLENFGRLIKDPRTPAGVRRRATGAVIEISLRCCDAAEAVVKAQQQAEPVEQEDLV